MVTRTMDKTTTTMVPIHRRHSTMIHITPALITKTRGLRRHPCHHHQQQWEATMEKVQHNLLCGHTTRTTILFTWHIHVFVVWFNYLRHIRFSRRNYVPLFGTCSHMPFLVLVVCFNYLRHVRFSSGHLYPSSVHVLTCHFMCCVC